MSKVFAFVGYSGSGKTWVTEKVIAELSKRGYSVGSIKHHSHSGFEIDYEGKDSWRHAQAGSKHVVIAAPDKLASIRELDHELSPQDIITNMPGLDIIIVEGYKDSGLTQIYVDRAANENPKKGSYVFGDNTLAVVSDIKSICEQATETGKSIFSFEDIVGICDFIIAQ